MSNINLAPNRFSVPLLYTTLPSRVPAEDVMAIRVNRAQLPWIQARQAIHLSSYAAGHREGRPTGHHIRAIGYPTRDSNCLAMRMTRLLKTQTCPKTLYRASSVYVSNSTASILPITISADATVKEVAELLRAHREEIETISESPVRRRELAGTRSVGLQAFTWLQQLDGLDEQHEIPKQLCKDLSWLLVAERAEQHMKVWLTKEGVRWKSTEGFQKPSAARYHGKDMHGKRTRRRHNHLTGLMEGHVLLSLDKTPADAIRCLHDVINDAIRLEIGDTFELAGATTVLHRAIQRESVPPISSSLFDEFLSMICSPGAHGPEVATDNTTTAKLFHPAAPNPWPMFLRLKHNVAHLRSLPDLRRSHWHAMGCLYFRVMLLLYLEGAMTEAKAVRDVLQRDFPSVWYHRKSMAENFKKDPKLRHIRARRSETANKGEQQYAFLNLDSEKLNQDDAAVEEIDGLFAETKMEEPDSGISSELLELRSARRR